MNKIKTILTSLALALILANPVSAKECHTVYGGDEVCETGDISVDKEIYNPETSEYWDNIDSSDYTFSADSEIKFRIKVKNTSDIDVDDVVVKDFLPEYIDYVSAEGADNYYHEADRMITYNLGKLSEDETDTLYLIAKVKNEDNIPTGLKRQTNKVEAYSDTDDQSDTDYTNFYIRKGSDGTVLGTTSPDTGVNSLILWGEMVGFVSLGAGYIVALKKYSK